MKRRLLSVVLAFVILLGLLPATALTASAASSYTTSREAIEVLKEWEGYLQYAKWDNGQYTIGYGTACNPGDYPNGISKAQAEALLREHLNRFETSVNNFADKHGLDMNQNKFDGLVLFSYNVGTAWMVEDSSIRQAVISGQTGNEFIFYLTRWCVSGGSVSRGHILRRLAEADIYLNGYYAKNAPDCFSYVLFNGNGGTYTYNVQGFDATSPVAVKGSAELSGYQFMGWYTAQEGGRWITTLDSTTKAITLYARWQSGNGPVDAEGNILGTEACYERVATWNVNVYASPSADDEVVTVVNKDDTVLITADYLDANGVKWGHLEDGGWIQLEKTAAVVKADAAPDRSNSVTAGSGKYDDEVEEEEPFCVTVTVTHDSVNFRNGPGTNSTKLGTLSKGKELIITEVVEVDGKLWGKFSYGWICLIYTDYEQVAEDQETENKVIAIGTVTSNGELRIRSGPGTAYATVGALNSGAEVHIYEIQTSGNMKWGRIANGWISLNYVKYSMVGEEDPKPSEPETGNKPEDSSTAVLVHGWVRATSLNVRDKIGTSGKVVARLPRDTYVTITEMVNYGGAYWGKIAQGWICMEYILVDKNNSDYGDFDGDKEPEQPGEQPGGNGGSSSTTTGMVTASRLCVRSGPGTGYGIVKTLNNGATVTILQQQLVDGTVWGQIEGGWICMTYVKLITDSNMSITNGIITASALCIRRAAGTGSAIVGSYHKGDVVAILEVTTVKGTMWGRTDKGWICMDYVETTNVPAPNPGGNEKPGEQEPVDPDYDPNAVIGEVTASNLTVRVAPGTNNAVVGSLPKGTRVTILQQTLVNGVIWGQIDTGWICMSYVNIISGSNVVVATGMVTATTLCIRSAAGTGNAIVGTYDRGDVIQIFEIKEVNKTIWGRTDKGWVSMAYVQTTINPDNGSSAPAVTAFPFTYTSFLNNLNAAMVEMNVLAVEGKSQEANVKYYELTFTDDGSSTGVTLRLAFDKDTNLATEITMTCAISDETACENLIILSAMGILLVDNTVTDVDLDAMLSGDPKVDTNGNSYYSMDRSTGTFRYLFGADTFSFSVVPHKSA